MNQEEIDRLIREAKAEAWEEGCSEGLSWNPGWDEQALASNPYAIKDQP